MTNNAFTQTTNIYGKKLMFEDGNSCYQIWVKKGMQKDVVYLQKSTLPCKNAPDRYSVEKINLGYNIKCVCPIRIIMISWGKDGLLYIKVQADEPYYETAYKWDGEKFNLIRPQL